MDADLRAAIELYAAACGLPVQDALVQAERLLASPMATAETIMRQLKALDVAPPKNTSGRRPDRPVDVAKIRPWTTQRGGSR